MEQPWSFPSPLFSPAPVATDAGCAAGRPEGAGAKVCRLERGSPGPSSEVISPEILKMRAALFCIFTYLDTRTLLRAAEVCKDWKFVARHPAVWTRVLLENARVSSKVLGTGWHCLGRGLASRGVKLCGHLPAGQDGCASTGMGGTRVAPAPVLEALQEHRGVLGDRSSHLHRRS